MFLFVRGKKSKSFGRKTFLCLKNTNKAAYAISLIGNNFVLNVCEADNEDVEECVNVKQSIHKYLRSIKRAKIMPKGACARCLKHALKARLHILFTHAFSTLRCVFY